MYFQIQEEITEITLKDINPDILTVGIISIEELEECYTIFNFSETTVSDCKNNATQRSHGNLDIYTDYLFGIMTGVNALQIIKVLDRIGIYIKTNLFLLVVIEDKDNSTEAVFLELIKHLQKSKKSLERIIYGFFDRMINEDYALLEKIEDDIIKHEDIINANKSNKKFNYHITAIRKRLLILDNYYQQLIAIGEELEENSADIFNYDQLHYFRTFTNRVTRLSNNTRMLQEYSVQVREAYHAQLEYGLNKTMNFFTVVTSIFLPLTLIVGWYGMNFTTMPELTWKYGYLYVIILSIIVGILCIITFKKKKFFDF